LLLVFFVAQKYIILIICSIELIYYLIYKLILKYNISNSEPNENNFNEPFNYNRSTSHINKKHVNNQVNALLADENSISNKNLLNTGAVNHNNNNNVYSYTSSSSSNNNNNNNNRSDSCGPSFRSQLIERL